MKLHALVIDDSPLMRCMIMQFLRRAKLADFRFTEASDGTDALAKFDPEDTDIIFVDWNMPNMTGIDFIQRLRALGNTGHIPVVMITSEKTAKKAQELRVAGGAAAYICKPFTVEDFDVNLRNVIDKLEAER